MTNYDLMNLLILSKDKKSINAFIKEVPHLCRQIKVLLTLASNTYFFYLNPI